MVFHLYIHIIRENVEVTIRTSNLSGIIKICVLVTSNDVSQISLIKIFLKSIYF